MGDNTLMSTFTMENASDGCKPFVSFTKLYRTFVLMSFEYGLSSALNAVGFIMTIKIVLKDIGWNSIPDWVFSKDVYR